MDIFIATPHLFYLPKYKDTGAKPVNNQDESPIFYCSTHELQRVLAKTKEHFKSLTQEEDDDI